MRRSRIVAWSMAVVLVATSGLAACSSVEVSTGGDTGSVAPADGGTVPAERDQATTTENADPDRPEADGGLAQEYIDALVTSFPDDGEEPWTLESVTCLAPKWLDAVGVEAFLDAGITPADVEASNGSFDDLPISEPVAEQMVDAIVECGVSLRWFAIEALPSAVRDDPETIACVDETVTDEDLRTVMVAAVTGDRDADPRGLVAPCIEEAYRPPGSPSSTVTVP